MAEESGVLRRIVWRDIFPGLILFRCFRLSISLPILFLATLGTLLMPLAPWVVRQLSVEPTTNRPIVAGTSSLPEPLAAPSVQLPRRPDQWVQFRWLPLGVARCYRTLTEPFVQFFDRDASWSQVLRSLGVAAWYLAIWALFGGAITRIAVVQLGRRERVPLGQSLKYVLSKYGWYFSSPLFPLAGIVLAALPLVLLGLVMKMNVGVFVAGLLWPLALIVGLIMATLLAELFFGWPLMWPTISSEEASDSFQAFSNSFSYTFQRPLPYFGYAVLAVLLGGLGGIFVEAFAQAVVMLSYWAVTFGLGRERLGELLTGTFSDAALVSTGLRLMAIGDRLVLVIGEAYYFSFFFCAASAIYLILRREVDQTAFDEVYIPDDAGRYSLPPLRPGPHGVPIADDSPAAPSAPQDDEG